ncbi:MAG: hypothetical protein QOH06_4582 [Acidobacteriota bacterium]|jgi:hypothetical protein|nr:hypothetical protein [Acidobacteriota bacterium]
MKNIIVITPKRLSKDDVRKFALQQGGFWDDDPTTRGKRLSPRGKRQFPWGGRLPLQGERLPPRGGTPVVVGLSDYLVICVVRIHPSPCPAFDT